MIGILTKTVYKYDSAELASGAKVTANDVTVQDGKVTNVPNGNVIVKVNEINKSFSFSVYSYGVGEATYNLNSVPAGVDGQAIIKEFVEFVEKDIA